MPALVLIVEDERDLAATLVFALEHEGFVTRAVGTGRRALEAAGEEPGPDIILLDLMLPDIPGTEVCRRLRAGERTADLPVIMMTAKADEIDRVVGFEVGADDYVVKPFSMRELLLRIRAILRRKGSSKPSDVHTVGRLRLDVAGHRVWVDGDEIVLTALEFRLLATLLLHAGRVLTRETLLSRVWETETGFTTRIVDTQMLRLRKRLGVAAEHIQTVRGVGYRFMRVPEDGD